RGRGPSRRPRASPRECAGSVETASTRWPDSASATAMAAEHVVLPTPPLPPKKRKTGAEVRRRRSAMAAGLGARGFVLARAFLVLFAREGGLDPRDLHLARGRGGGAVALADLADAGPEVLLRLRGQQLLAQDGVVAELLVDGLHDLVEDKTNTAHDERIDKNHHRRGLSGNTNSEGYSPRTHPPAPSATPLPPGPTHTSRLIPLLSRVPVSVVCSRSCREARGPCT